MENKVSIEYLVDQMIKAQLNLGIAMQTVYGGHYVCLTSIRGFFQERGEKNYSQAIMEQYLEMLQGRLDNGEICHDYYMNMLRVAERLTEIYETGRLKWSCRTKLSKFVLNDEYEKTLAGFLSHYKLHHNTRGDFIWVIRKYLSYLQLEGCDKISRITTNDLTKFIVYCSQQVKRGTLHDIICYTKRFHKYLEETGLLSIQYRGILSISIIRESKIQQPITSEEVNTILDGIDTSRVKGKRNYAIILLGTVMGLRAVDIVNLKLRDIDWRKNEIRVLQQKTGRTVLLPLLPEVGEALKNYILCGRHESESEYIFLRLRAPFKKISDSRSIGNMFDSYQKEVGIERQAFDGKGFHSLRRRLGREMTIEGVPVTTVAQVLGHGNTDSAKQYISLDSIHLQECALDFGGIGEGGLI